MMLLKKFLIAVLPLVLAVVFLGVCLLVPFEIPKDALPWAATSLSTSIFKGAAIKQKALQNQDPIYIPFFGSSELRRFDAMHPAVLAKKYKRDYRPFLLGTAGTQSLSHFLSIHSMGASLEGKRAIFIISPQWFTGEGAGEGAFEKLFSPLQAYDYICDTNTNAEERAYFAKRMRSFEFVRDDARLSLLFPASGKEPDANELRRAENHLKILRAEDRFFSRFFVENHDFKIRSLLRQLPDAYDEEKLDAIAEQAGKNKTSNNPFGIQNEFYSARVKAKLQKMEGSQRDVSYDISPEYGDLELVLSQIASRRMDVLFVIPPVNESWTDFTGLSMEMYQRCVRKIKIQLTDQGFTRILDLSGQGREPYYLQDTIHLGWRGWLAIDRAVKPFLESDETTPPVYHIDPAYYSDAWCEKVVE